MISNTQILLNAINWNFFEKEKELTNKLHWYPGTFPQEIPATLIEALTTENDTVFDPYGGIGTTIAEALRLNRKCITTDINPVAVLSSYISAIFMLANYQYRQYIKEYLCYILCLLDVENSSFDFASEDNTKEIDFDTYFSNLILPDAKSFYDSICIATPNWENLNKWIHEDTLLFVQKIYQLVIDEKQFVKKLILLEMCSSILFSISSQRRSWGHIADNVYPKIMENRNKELINSCKRWINQRAIKLLNNKYIYNHSTFRAIILQQNWLKETNSILLDYRFDLLLTSPPYANAIDYLKSQKLSLYLFGYSDFDISLLTNDEIGARTKRRFVDSTENWANDLVNSLIKQYKLSNKQSSFTFILPNEDSGRAIGNNMIKDFFYKKNTILLFEKERSINQQKTTQSWTSIKKEKIIVFQKGGNK